MMADPDSRTVNYNEEYIPARFFRKICVTVGFWPTLDMMATPENKRTMRFVNRGPSNDPNMASNTLFEYFFNEI